MQGISMGEGLRERDWARALTAALVALLVGTLAFAMSQTERLSAAQARVDAVTQKAFYETCELTEGMAVNLSKLRVAADNAQAQQLLNEVALQTQGALSNLALLPLGQETVSATLKFINQAGDFSTALSTRLGGGGNVEAADRESIAALSDSAAIFAAGMRVLLDRYERGEAVFSGADYGASGAESLYPLTDPAADYPVLLYDGPFSDGRANGEFKALRGLVPVTEAQARAALTGFLGNGARAGFTGESLIPVECYEYAVEMGDYRLLAGVTKAGGEVLYVLSDSAVGAENLTRAQAVAAAEGFLADRGFAPMEMSYASLFDGILTVNFAAMQDGVILYPDLVKVQVSMADGAVIGLEAARYLMNHVRRALPVPMLTEAEALARVGDRLTPASARLCVIPLDAGEALCYEVTATAGSDTFLAYIDAQTGEERELMQVIRDENGALVM